VVASQVKIKKINNAVRRANVVQTAVFVLLDRL